MANEIQFTDATGRTDYVNLTNEVGLWWNVIAAAYQAFNPANFAAYDLPATEFGTSRVYEADMPAAIPAGVVNVVARNRVAGAPPSAAAQSDPVVAVGSIVWSGAAVVTLALPAETPGRPATLEGMMRRVFEDGHNAVIRDRATGAKVIRNAAGTATLETAQQSTTGESGAEVDTQTKGV